LDIESEEAGAVVIAAENFSMGRVLSVTNGDIVNVLWQS